MTLRAGVLTIAFGRSITQRPRVSMPELPLLSIIIVAYQSRPEIGACLASVPSTLEGRPIEVGLIDNSPGADAGCGDEARRNFPGVDYIAAEENLGFGRANNRGYQRSRGEFVLFLNPDTVVNIEALTHCLARLREDETIGLISPRLELADGSMDLACRRSIPTLWDGLCRASGLATRFPHVARFAGYNLTHLSPEGTYAVGAINGAFMMGRRAVLQSVAPNGAVFDEHFFMYGDDLDLCIRVTDAGWRIIYDGRVRITHLKGVSVARDFERMASAIFDANRDVYLKHFNPRGSRFVQWKYRLAFGAWKRVALLRARWRGYRQVRPI